MRTSLDAEANGWETKASLGTVQLVWIFRRGAPAVSFGDNKHAAPDPGSAGITSPAVS